MNLFEELKRRKVLQTAAIYVAVAWGATGIIVTIADKFSPDDWVSQIAIIAFIVGFPIAPTETLLDDCPDSDPFLSTTSSLTILPFTNLSGEPSNDYLASGFSANLAIDINRHRRSFKHTLRSESYQQN